MQDEARRSAAALNEAAVIDAKKVIYTGPVHVHYGFFTLTAFPDDAVPGSDVEPLTANPTACAGPPPHPWHTSAPACTQGAVTVEVLLAPARPPVDSDRWEEIVELDHHVETPVTMLAGFTGGTELAIPLGHYRMRFSASHMDQAHQSDTDGHVDAYQLLLWPHNPTPQAPKPTDTILKVTSSIAKARHASQ